MTNQKGFSSVIAMFVALIIIMALASAVSKPASNNSTDQQYQDPTIQVDINPTNQNTQYPMQSIQTACNYMGGSWYQNTNTCAGNIDTNKCVFYGGKINGCDSSCRYASSRSCPINCEVTCTFNGPYITTNQQYQNPTYYTQQIQNPIYQINNNQINTVYPTDNPLSKYCSSNWYLVDGNKCPNGMWCDTMVKPIYLQNYTTGETFNLSVDTTQWLKNNCLIKPVGL